MAHGAGSMFEKIVLGVILVIIAFSLLPTADESAATYAADPNTSAVGEAIAFLPSVLIVVGVILYFVYGFTKK